MTQSFIAPGISQMSPYLMVKDPDSTIAFYQKAFGFDLAEEGAMKDENGVTQHVHMKMGDVHVMFGREGSYDVPNKSPISSKSAPGAIFYVYCANTDAQFKKAIAAGAKVLKEPQDTFWDDRICSVEDQDGYHWTFATHIGKSSK